MGPVDGSGEYGVAKVRVCQIADITVQAWWMYLEWVNPGG